MSSLKQLTRREAVKRSAAAIGSVVATSMIRTPRALAATSPVGANERVNVGIIGTGARGKTLIGNLLPSVRVGAICDCATARIADTLRPKGRFGELLSKFREADASRCATYQDYREAWGQVLTYNLSARGEKASSAFFAPE